MLKNFLKDYFSYSRRERNGIITLLGIILVIMGAAVCVVALWRYNHITDILEGRGTPVIPKLVAYILVSGLLLVTFLVLLIILIG